MKGDLAASYKSDTYPWLEYAARYEMIGSHFPADNDAVMLKVPGFSGPGHYIAAWRWRGYYDCTDVDLFDKPVTNTYGTKTGEMIWNKIDHCQYPAQKPYILRNVNEARPSRIVSSCMDATYGAEGCQLMMKKKYTSNSANTQATFDNLRLGINVVQLNNPGNIMFSEIENLPWNNGTCQSGLQWTKAPGKISFSDVPLDDTNAWKTTKVVGKTCGNAGNTITGTLRDAILACTKDSCTGIAWKHSGAFSESVLYVNDASKRFDFQLCKQDASTKVDADYTAFMKRNTPQTIAQINPPTLVADVVFGSSLFTAAAGKVKDEGALYGNRGGGLNYGWSCTQKKDNFHPTSSDVAKGWQNFPWVANVDNACDDGSAKLWEMKVQNGVYKVTATSDMGKSNTNNAMAGCTIENIRLTPDQRTKDGDVFVVEVEVMDGRLTLSGPEGKDPAGDRRSLCRQLSTLKIEKLATKLPQVWMPSTPNPWYQFEMDQEQDVGLITIKTPGVDTNTFDCRSSLLYRGKTCPKHQIQGYYNLSTGVGKEGAVVRVTDKPCDASGGCSKALGNAKTHICSTVTIPNRCKYWTGTAQSSLCPVQIDCHGVRVVLSI